MTVSVLELFLRVLWVGLHFVIVVFPGHTCLLYEGDFDDADAIIII